jgi:hypothetical protein
MQRHNNCLQFSQMKEIHRSIFSLSHPSFAACLLLSFLLGGVIRPAVASDIYISQSTVGGDTGADAADSHSEVWLNTPTNWGPGANQIGPGTTVHLVGTITNFFSILGSGSPGSPITILFESNAVMSAPVWYGSPNSSYCAIYGFGVHDVVINGGVNGAINATDCGDLLDDKTGCNGVTFVDATRVTVENLSISNLFVRFQSSTNEIAGGSGIGFGSSGTSAGAGGDVVSNCVVHDTRTGIGIAYGPNWTNMTVVGCTISNVSWGIQVGDGNSLCNLNGFTARGNNIHGFANWDDPGDIYHHDGIIVFADSGWATNIVIAGNHFGPGYGAGSTAAVYVNSGIYSELIYNNIFDCTDGSSPHDAMLYTFLNYQSYSRAGIYNNTFVGANGGLGVELSTGYSPSLTFYSMTNNLFYNIGVAVAQEYYTTASMANDYNLYYGVPLSGNSGFVISANNSAAFLNWYNGPWNGSNPSWVAFGHDVHGVIKNPRLDAKFVPQGNSSVFNAGVNLSQFFTNDFAGNPRPSGTNAWDIGAFQHVGILPPFNLRVISPLPVGASNDVDGLVAWWPLDDLSGANVVTNSYTLTFAGSPSLVAGEITNGVSFNGSSQFAVVSAPVTAVPLTMAGWFNTTSPNGLIFGLFNGTQSGWFSYFMSISSGKIAGYTANNISATGAISPLTYDDGNWHYTATVFTSGQQILYVDGKPVGTNSTAMVPTGLNEFCIGASERTGTTDNYFDGEIDDVRIYNRALSAGEIASQYQWPTGGRP